MTIATDAKQIYETNLQTLIDMCDARARGAELPEDYDAQKNEIEIRCAAYVELTGWQQQLDASLTP